MKQKTLFILLALCFQVCSIQSFSQRYKDSKAPIEERVRDLLARMTQEEKFWQLYMIPGDLSDGKEKYKNGIFGLQVQTPSVLADNAGQIIDYKSFDAAAETAKKINEIQKYFVEQTRLGIPIIPFDETLHGLIRDQATVFPQSIALAATWDVGLMRRIAYAIALETKSRGIRQVLSPVVNVATDVRWGRTEETYGEDPFLVSEMSVAYVSAFEKLGVITTPKHFIANSGDGGRDSYPVYLSERALEECYLVPFKACIFRGGSKSIMTSYNALDGVPCTANNWLINTKLKTEWGFTGFVISDACAVGGANVLHNTAKDYCDATVNAMKGGLDVIFQTSFEHYTLFYKAFQLGLISQKVIDDAVARVLRMKFELGLFENPFVDVNETAKYNATAENRKLAKEAALKSIVLLKNDNNTLPLQQTIKSILVVGSDANEARTGGYSGPGTTHVRVLDGIKNKAGRDVNVIYAKGCNRTDIDYVPIRSDYLTCAKDKLKTNGLNAEYYNNITLWGTPVVTRVDPSVNFRWTLYGPDTAINFDFFSARWTGELIAPETGTFKIGLEGNDGYRLYINNLLVIDNWKKQSFGTKLCDFAFTKGESYAIRLEFYESTGGAWFKLVWNYGVQNNWQKEIAAAVEMGKQCDIVVVDAGIEEGEGKDRAFLSLPGHQQEMIVQLAAIGKPVLVLLTGGSAITMNGWLDKVQAVVDVWYGGEESGNAVAEVLFGSYNPAGRLPITFPIAEGQLPLNYNHTPTGRNDDYEDLSGKSLFPFGFGLSYTTFNYRDLHLVKQAIKTTDSTEISFYVKNTGSVAGEEVVQLYITDIVASVARPVMALKGFQRIFLKAGEEQKVVFEIKPEMLVLLNSSMKWVVEPGDFRIMIGASSENILLRGVLSVE
ncbi:MAG: glycoside hydrolase family 3 N-terminal domain-containing protein [Bacteroidota bacterium]